MDEKYRIGVCNSSGVETEYMTFGHGKKTLVILPGLSVGRVLDSAGQIAGAYALFAEEFTVYLFERRKDLPEVYTVEDMAVDAFAAMTSLGLRDVCLFGVSQGGMIAQTVAIEHPGFLSKLVLASTAARVGEETGERMKRLLEKAEKGRRTDLILSFARLIYSDGFMKKFGPMIRLSALRIGKKDLARFEILARGCIGFSCLDRLGSISCPTLVLGAENDKITGSAASLEIAERIGCECFLYPAPYGHAVYDEAPDFKERILRFLNT